MTPIPPYYSPQRRAEIEQQRKERVVYFIRAVNGTGPVKIGVSRNPTKRLAELSIWCPFALTVLATIPGGFDLEREYHVALADARSHGEWFHWTPEVAAAVEAALSAAQVAA